MSPLPRYIVRHWVEELVRFSLPIKSYRSRMLMYIRTHYTLTDPRDVRALQSIHRPLRLKAWKYPRLAQGPSRNC